MTSWKTTLGGILMTVGLALAQTEDWKWVGLILQGAGGLLLGWAAKDSNVTGGTTPQ